MRLLITGWQGQVARSLAQAAAKDKSVEALAIGRPALDLVKLPTILRTLSDARPDVVINTAAYTAVDKAETEPAAAQSLNCDGARLLAEASAERGVPIIHLSTDYVFDGSKATPYVESDPTAPLGVYGRSKLAGELAVAAANPRHVILRTAWVHSPFGQNFVKTMLRLGAERKSLRVVDDQVGSPTYAPHLAAAILAVARQIAGAPAGSPHFGLYHGAGRGEVSWCGLAREIFRLSEARGGPSAALEPIPTSGYPTPAQRPANSRLDCRKLEVQFGVALPDWHVGVEDCVERILAGTD